MPCEKRLENQAFLGLPAFHRSALRTVEERRRESLAPTWCVVRGSSADVGRPSDSGSHLPVLRSSPAGCAGHVARAPGLHTATPAGIDRNVGSAQRVMVLRRALRTRGGRCWCSPALTGPRFKRHQYPALRNPQQAAEPRLACRAPRAVESSRKPATTHEISQQCNWDLLISLCRTMNSPHVHV